MNLIEMDEQVSELNTSVGFAEELRQSCISDWNACVKHRFVNEIFDGSLSDAVLRKYLVQDYSSSTALWPCWGQPLPVLMCLIHGSRCRNSRP